MKIIISLAIMSIATISYALSVDEAFQEFYQNKMIDSNHCGKNIHYFLKYLKEKNVSYNSGYVVSVHHDQGNLYHFDPRWGNLEHYADETPYLRANYFFHVFVVIDHIAYDFSQRNSQNQDVFKYLKKSYLPLKKTKSISFQGSMTPEKMLKNYYNTKLKIYSTKDYEKNLKGLVYEGRFIELFDFYEKNPRYSNEKTSGNYQLDYEEKESTSLGVNYYYPSVIMDGKKMKLAADATKICNAFGFLGSVPFQTLFEVTDNVSIYKVYASLKTDSKNDNDFSISFKQTKSVGAVHNQPLLHMAKLVSCTDLASVLDLLNN